MPLSLADFITVNVGGLTRYQAPGGTRLYSKMEAQRLLDAENYFGHTTIHEMPDPVFLAMATRDLMNCAVNLVTDGVGLDPVQFVLTPPPITAQADNYNPAGFTQRIRVLRLSTVGAQTVTGLAGGSGIRQIDIWNVGVTNLGLRANAVESLAPNRFIMGANVTLNANETTRFQYDPVSLGWRLIGAVF